MCHGITMENPTLPRFVSDFMAKLLAIVNNVVDTISAQSQAVNATQSQT